MTTNSVTVTGRLGEKPELRLIPSTNNAATEFSLAFQRRRQDAQGNWVDGETDWFRVKAYRKLAEMVSRLAGGTLVRVTGRLVQERWEEEGGKRQTVKIAADQIDISLHGLRDLEAGKGYADLRWGRLDSAAPVNNGVEDVVFSYDDDEPDF